MKVTTWTGNIENGKVMPTKTSRVINPEIIKAMQNQLNDKALSL